jgi:O-Antigen ligase
LEAAPLGLVLALVALMVVRGGGFAATVWYPVALFVLGVVLTVALAARPRLAAAPRAVLAAVGCLAGFTLWSFATIGWAVVRSSAWYGSDRIALYLLVFALLACWPADARRLWPVLLGVGVVTAVEGVVTVEQAIGHPAGFLLGSRLSAPLGYSDATAALFMTMAWLMLGLASRSWLPAPVRGLATGLAVLQLALSLLAQSRGSVYTLPAVVVAYLILVPGRLRSIATLALAACGIAPLIQPVLDFFRADPASLSHALSRAIDFALLSALIVAVAGWGLATVDRRWRPSRRTTRGVAVALVAAVVLLFVGSVVVVRPWQYAGSVWHSFKYGQEPAGTVRFGGLGSNRYDFWRVGLVEFERHPLAGIGTDNFLVPYLQLRHSSEEPIYPHSLAIDLLSQTGVVGTVLFAGFLVLVGIAVVRIPPGRNRELASVLGVGASVLVFHGLVDWLWEMPVLGVLGAALLGAACSLAPRRPLREREPSRLEVAARSVALLAAGLALAASFVFPWLAVRDVQNATARWRSDPAAAFSLLGHAASLNPVDDDPDLVAGEIASRLHRYDLMRARFGDAVARTPDDWYANLELGIAASLTGQRGRAAAALARARRLDPAEPIIRQVITTFRSGRPIDSDAVDRAFGSGSG